jgi:hypothetical protein
VIPPIDLGLYRLDGKTPVKVNDTLEWARWLETHDAERIVARTRIAGAVVSTVFLGVDYGLGRIFGYEQSPPVLFETMTFREDDAIRGRVLRHAGALLHLGGGGGGARGHRGAAQGGARRVETGRGEESGDRLVKEIHVTAAEAATAMRLTERFRHLLHNPPALVEEMRRQGRKPHVREDEELSFLLGMLLGYVVEKMETK